MFQFKIQNHFMLVFKLYLFFFNWPQCPVQGWNIRTTSEPTWTCCSWWPGASGHSESSSAPQGLRFGNITHMQTWRIQHFQGTCLISLLLCPIPPGVTRWLIHIVSNPGGECDVPSSIFSPPRHSIFLWQWLTHLAKLSNSFPAI